MASTMFAVPDWFPEELRGVLMLTLPGQESPVRAAVVAIEGGPNNLIYNVWFEILDTGERIGRSFISAKEVLLGKDESVDSGND